MKNLSLGMKISFGFALVLIFLCIVAFIGFNSLSGVVDRASKSEGVNELVKSILDARQQEKNYIMRNDETLIAKVDDLVKGLTDRARGLKDNFTQKANKDQMDLVIEKSGAYLAAFHGFVDLRHQKTQTMALMREKAGVVLKEAEDISADQKAQLNESRKKSTALIKEAAVDSGLEQKTKLADVQKQADDFLTDRLAKSEDTNLIIKWFLDGRKNEKEFIISGDKKWMDEVNDKVEKIKSLSQDLKSRFKLQQNIDQVNTLLTALKEYDDAFKEYSTLTARQKQAEEIMLTEARAAREVCISARADQKAKMESQISTANRVIFIGTIIALVLGILSAFFITRSITGPVNRIIAGLNEGSAQVASASGQVSSSSQSMAEGASQQAASIEETSSSMEEMSSMTKRNADNAGQADNLMKETNKVVATANKSMDQLTQSMADISKASEETSKIIKTIDEIAFQTNLLALNAAVEAARAGEAGAGFAVVADEVRNLAMRASDAAKNTAALIEGTVKKVKDGSELVSTTNDAFSQVAESSAKVGDIVSEIAAASKEQSSGIEQVNIAITEMDKVVQQNAANAEESASASEEMSAQAEQLKDYVSDLVMLVTGKKNQTRAVKTHHVIKNISSKPKSITKGKNKLLAGRTKEVRPDQVIPFDDDDDFKDF